MKIRLAVIALLCVLSLFGQEKKQKMDPNKPAGEQFKNVKVLTTVPSGQFLQTMRSFNAALGVECSFCHVQDRSSDEKKEKLMARSMITMSHEINEKFFKGEMEVRCFTCHQGKEHPVSAPPSAATAPAAEKK